MAKPGSKLAALREQRERQFEERTAVVNAEDYYAEKVVGCLGRAAEAVIEAGGWLREAKEKIEHGRWEPWVEERVGLSPRSAQRYMRISARLPKATRVAVLPSSVRVLDKLAGLNDEEMGRVQSHITPELTSGDLKRLLREDDVEKDERELREEPQKCPHCGGTGRVAP